MALTYDESNTLRQNQTLRGRVQTACLKFADSILGEDASVPAHNARMRWANECNQMPDQVTMKVVPWAVNDAQVQTDGANITDAALQVSVETAIMKML